MKFLDKIWSVLGLVEAEDQEDPQTERTGRPEPTSDRRPERSAKAAEAVPSRKQAALEPPAPALPAQPTKMLPEPAPAVSTGRDAYKVTISHPVGFDDARMIGENLKSGKTVVVNFENTDSDTTKRTVDFMSGITYAVGGTVQRISTTIFLFAPSHVEVFAPERNPGDEPGTQPWRRT